MVNQFLGFLAAKPKGDWIFCGIVIVVGLLLLAGIAVFL